MKTENTEILEHRLLMGDYMLLVLNAPEISKKAIPGQFIHVRIPLLDSPALRRPFSLYRAGGSTLSVLYKVVGRGTEALAKMRVGDMVDVIGPLGNGFPVPEDKSVTPILVAGGFGVAPLYFLAESCKNKGVLFVGGASSQDILCIEEFEHLGWDVCIATMDGSLGEKGLVTDILDDWFSKQQVMPDYLPEKYELFACGPDGMLEALAGRTLDWGIKGWLSLDKHMGCGVGACLACVQKLRNDDGDEYWGRVCKDGPVFESRQIVWEK